MNFQQKVVQAKELLQQIADNGGTPYFPETFYYDRGIGWMCKADYDFEIEWCDFNYCSHETGMTVYRNLNDVIKRLRADRNWLCDKDDTPDGSDIVWGSLQDG